MDAVARKKMATKVETAILAAVTVIACASSSFIIAWWSAAFLSETDLIPLTPDGVMWSAVGGLVVGALVAIFRARRWTRRVYEIGGFMTLPIYIAWSAMATGLFMGLPVGNLALGAGAGLYVGRRARRLGLLGDDMRRVVRRVSLFAAGVTGFFMLAIGVLALMDRHSIEFALSIFGIAWLSDTRPGRIGVVAAATAGCAILQFVLTRWAALAAFRLGGAAVPDSGDLLAKGVPLKRPGLCRRPRPPNEEGDP